MSIKGWTGIKNVVHIYRREWSWEVCMEIDRSGKRYIKGGPRLGQWLS